jgi:AraC family transcriptional regulator
MAAARATLQTLTKAAKADRAHWDITTSFSSAKREARSVLASEFSECDILRQAVKITPLGAAKRHSATRYGLTAESVYVPAQSRIELRFAASVHLLAMYAGGMRRDGGTSVNGSVPSRLRNVANKLTFVPADRAYSEWHETCLPMRISYLYLPSSKLHKSDGDDTSYEPKVFVEDSVVWETAAKLISVIESGKTDVFYIDALTKVLAHELARSEGELVSTTPASHGGLATWQMRIIAQHIEDRLEENISLATLASLARLSQSHFSRAFKQSFGIPPHEYHTQRRIQKAKTLLVERDASVTEVGFALGYSHTSSFSIAFRKITGRSPREFRRDFM